MPNEAAELLSPPGAAFVGSPTLDARTAALLRLKLFVSLLRFFRAGDRGGPPAEFRVPLDNVLEEWPDAEKDLKLPAFAFLPGPGISEGIALGGPLLCEESVGRYGPNTALEQTGVYREQLTIEAWSSPKAERRGLVAGLKLALLSGAGTIRMRLPDYYDQIATFLLEETLYVDDPDVIRGRRRAQLKVAMTVPEVRLVSYPTLRVIVEVRVRDRGDCGEGEVIVETEV